jgi:glycosyltransferase involved in cell wall biosynthesis
MLGLAEHLPNQYVSRFVSFSEGGHSQEFLQEAAQAGFESRVLKNDTPRLLAARRELIDILRQARTDVVIPHGYKSNLIGLFAARRLGIPIISVSHGWTGESFRVRLFERLDRRVLRYMDKVVCVSECQSQKALAAGVPREKVQVIRDAVRHDRFAGIDYAYRVSLERMFPTRPRYIVGAAGRLSPEKGFKHFVDAASQVLQHRRINESRADDEQFEIAFVIFGEGPLRGAIQAQIKACGLEDRFILAGFRSDLDKFYPHLDLLVLPSYTEGLPNVVLEASAAGVPVVATAVGGTPEAVEDGVNGYLVPPADATALAKRIDDMLSDPARRKEMGALGRERIIKQFSFAQQGAAYLQLFESMLPASTPCHRGRPRQSAIEAKL